MATPPAVALRRARPRSTDTTGDCESANRTRKLPASSRVSSFTFGARPPRAAHIRKMSGVDFPIRRGASTVQPNPYPSTQRCTL